MCKILSDCLSLSAYFSFSVAQQPILDVDRLTVDVSRSHTVIHVTSTAVVISPSQRPLHYIHKTHTRTQK
jgi:hypothetical protein